MNKRRFGQTEAFSSKKEPDSPGGGHESGQVSQQRGDQAVASLADPRGTKIDADGVKTGFDIDLNRTVSEAVTIPVIASGGAGAPEHFLDVFKEGKADAGLAASVFHFGEINIKDLKRYLADNGVNMRI